MKIKAFCEHCNKQVVCNEEGGHTLYNELFDVKFTGFIATCTECDNPVESGTSFQKNLNIIDNIFRSRSGIISVQDVKRISVKDISNNLNISFASAKMIYDGATPTASQSKILKSLIA